MRHDTTNSTHIGITRNGQPLGYWHNIATEPGLPGSCRQPVADNRWDGWYVPVRRVLNGAPLHRLGAWHPAYATYANVRAAGPAVLAFDGLGGKAVRA